MHLLKFVTSETIISHLMSNLCRKHTRKMLNFKRQAVPLLLLTHWDHSKLHRVVSNATQIHMLRSCIGRYQTWSWGLKKHHQVTAHELKQCCTSVALPLEQTMKNRSGSVLIQGCKRKKRGGKMTFINCTVNVHLHTQMLNKTIPVSSGKAKEEFHKKSQTRAKMTFVYRK